ncbi:MAG: T9SS type A sorting domain-containing protein [Bacteroidota bacterium]
MKKTLLACLFKLALPLFATSIASGQTYHIACQVAASAGGEGNVQGKNYAFTLGEAVIATFDQAGSPKMLTQGFHQPECSDAPLVGVQNLEPDFQVSLFPNPASAFLLLQFSPAPSDACTVRVFDLLGQAVLPPTPLNAWETQQVEISALLPGWYFLQVEMHRQHGVVSLPFVKM